MKALFTGIYNLFAPVGAKPTFYTALGGQMYLTEAPQNTNYPYAIYHLVSNNYDFTFEEDLEEFMIQFSIYDDKASAIYITTYFENLKTLYDWATPSITGYDTVWMARDFAELLRLDGVWQYVIQYRILLKKQ